MLRMVLQVELDVVYKYVPATCCRRVMSSLVQYFVIMFYG